MSVLAFPRIYFKGYAAWDPCTFNNNDWQAFPTYDGANAALNWSFLKTQDPQITPENFTTTFRPWAIKLQNDTEDKPNGARVPAEWNMFGSHGVSFVQYGDKVSTVTGGALGYGQPSDGDPLIGAPIAISGDGGNGPGRLVDTNPFSFWSSQIYYGMLQIGGANQFVKGPRVERMHSRWVNLNRLYSATPELTEPAAAVACCFQACISNSDIQWQNNPDPGTGATSKLLAALQQAASQPGAQGVMIRFTAYANLYFQNGIFNNITQQPRNYRELANVLAAAWDAWNQNGSTEEFFSQPCYSNIVGAVGVWNESELVSVPGGRYLSPAGSVTPSDGTAATTLGPVVANVNYAQELISLDFGSAIPEVALPNSSDSDLRKANFGTLTLGTQAGGVFIPIAGIPYAQYRKSAYEASAGIIDIPFPNAGTGNQLQNGLIAIQVQSPAAAQAAHHGRGHAMFADAPQPPVLALGEQAYSAQTDGRGIYLDQSASESFQISVLLNGAPAAGAQVLVVKYDENLQLIHASATQFVNFTNGQIQTIEVSGVATSVTVLTAGSSGDSVGVATATIAAESPGFPALGFFPFAAGQTLPSPPSSLLPPGPGPFFFTTVRVLPFDNAVPIEFLALWNASHDPTHAWNFIYNQILYVYDMLFSVMLEYVDLGSQSAVEKNASGILSAISATAEQESTYAMPITRDLSAGKRLTLQLWIYLVQNNYQVPVLTTGMIQA